MCGYTAVPEDGRTCFHFRQHRCIRPNRPYLDFKTPSTVASSIIYSKHDYCNSLYYNLPKSQINHLQQSENSRARVVAEAPECCHITSTYSHSFHWLNITERFHSSPCHSHIRSPRNQRTLCYRRLALSTGNLGLHDLIAVQPHGTRSSSDEAIVGTLDCLPISFSLRITDRSFRLASPCLWNQPPASVRQPHSSLSLLLTCSYTFHIIFLYLLTYSHRLPLLIHSFHL